MQQALALTAYVDLFFHANHSSPKLRSLQQIAITISNVTKNLHLKLTP